jgi:hypothetical protein
MLLLSKNTDPKDLGYDDLFYTLSMLEELLSRWVQPRENPWMVRLWKHARDEFLLREASTMLSEG